MLKKYMDKPCISLRNKFLKYVYNVHVLLVNVSTKPNVCVRSMCLLCIR